VDAWCQDLTSDGGLDRHIPLDWIKLMLRRKSEAVCTARMLCDRIAEVNNDPEITFSFVGRCCTEDDDSAESLQSDDECYALSPFSCRPQISMAAKRPASSVSQLRSSRRNCEKQDAARHATAHHIRTDSKHAENKYPDLLATAGSSSSPSNPAVLPIQPESLYAIEVEQLDLSSP
jgi:hypothetical protein